MITDGAGQPHGRHSQPLVTLLALFLTVRWTSVLAGTCPTETVGVDSSLGNTYFAIYDGSAYGQVFEAKDTVLQAISVWRHPLPNNAALRAYVLELDSTGVPDPSRVLGLGPTLTKDYGDGVHPVRFRFVFEPPVSLPGRGLYELAVQVAPPQCDAATSLLGDTLNPYPAGGAWLHPRTDVYFDCKLRTPRPAAPGVDLVFEVEFCEKTPTAVRRSSWGELKVRYR